MSSFRIEPLSGIHDRNGFSCGQPILDRYLQHQASQDVRRRVANCFVAVASGDERPLQEIAAYYTLAASSVPLEGVPVALAKKLPRYPLVPAVLIDWVRRC